MDSMTGANSEVWDSVAKTHYDIVFASTGVLCWIPEIENFAITVRQLLKPGGFFYLHDGHPLLRKQITRLEEVVKTRTAALAEAQAQLERAIGVE